MKVYISGPMTGLPEHNYPAFNAAAAMLRHQGHTVISPAELPCNAKPAQSWDYYMRYALRAMLECEGVYVLQGSSSSRGACTEVNLARTLGFTIVYQKANDLNPNHTFPTATHHMEALSDPYRK